jgi:hypothetical protein
MTTIENTQLYNAQMHKIQVIESIKNAFSRTSLMMGDNNEHWGFCENTDNQNMAQFQAINCAICGKYKTCTNATTMKMYGIGYIDDWRMLIAKCIVCRCV